MPNKLVAALFLLAMIGAIASPIASERLAIESETPSLPVGWELGSRSPSSQPIRLMFGLKQQNLAQLEQTMLAVSDPESKCLLN